MSSRLKSHKLVLLGETFVGKSSLVLRFVRGQFNESLESTVGAAYMTQTVMTMGKTIKFEIWDTAGQERYRSLAPMYYRGAKAAIVMYDITSKDSFECAKTWIEELKLKAQSVDVIAFVGNKIDLEKMRKVPTEEAEEYSKDNSLLFMEISVKDSVNVNEIFTEIAKQLPASFENTVPSDDSNDGFSIPKESDINSSQSGCVC